MAERRTVADVGRAAGAGWDGSAPTGDPAEVPDPGSRGRRAGWVAAEEADRGAGPAAVRCDPPPPGVGPGGSTARRGGTSLLAAPFICPEKMISGARRTGIALPAMAAEAAPGR